VSIASLLAGSHTLRYWYAGPQLQRVALLGTTDETDVFRSGSDVWQWDSSDAVAVHATVHGQVSQPLAPPSIGSLTPQQLVTRLVASLDPATTVTVDGTRTVADRDAYVLVLTPRDSSTRVASVRIAVDGTTKIPLGVQVYARGGSTAALDVAFSDVSFATPSPANFAFTPPPGAKVTEGFGTVAEAGSAPRASIIGTGWSSVVEYHAASAAVGALAGGTSLRMTPVSGAWGKGRLLDLPLFSVLVADDGRVFAGAVDPDVLYRAAAAHN
jgi:outer membrane lipoprotein-sorting protein